MGAIQNSINYALGTAAIASGLTNKKTAEKAQDKLDKTKDKLTNTEGQLVNTKEDLAKTEGQLAKTEAEKDKVIKQQAEEKYEQNIAKGGNTFNVSNDLPTAKETNVDADDKIDVINTNSVNKSIGSSMADFLKYQQKVDPYTFEQFMGFHALKMSDSMVDAKRAVKERTRRAMISPLAREAREKIEAKEDETYSFRHGLNLRTMRALKAKEDGTYSFRDGRLVKENLKSGYQVSFFRPEITDENIQSVLKKIGSKLGPAYLGLYEGSPEISYSFKDKDKAMEFAQAFNQYSIWDNKEGKEILNDKYNERAKIDYNVALDNFTKARDKKWR